MALLCFTRLLLPRKFLLLPEQPLLVRQLLLPQPLLLLEGAVLKGIVRVETIRVSAGNVHGRVLILLHEKLLVLLGHRCLLVALAHLVLNGLLLL